MDLIEEAIVGYEKSLLKELDIIALRQKNLIAHQWKVTYQSLCLRETVAWRFVDIIGQSWFLHKNEKALGSRILLRSAIETLAMLIRLNQLTEQLITKKIPFISFCESVLNLLLGCRDETTGQQAKNIMSIFHHCEKKYEGIKKTYEWLSESAHPNFEGMRVAYSKTNDETMVTTFSKNTSDLYSKMQADGCLMAMSIFEAEYTLWEKLFENMEDWLVENDAELQKSKPMPV